jgi:hypothetical protein
MKLGPDAVFGCSPETLTGRYFCLGSVLLVANER